MTPAEELRAAAAKLRTKLPVPIAMVPRVVQGDAETMSALAWCEDHGDWDGNPPPDDAGTSACFNCDIAELMHPALAELIRDLLAAREQIAAQVEDAAEAWKHVADLDGQVPARHPLALALATARAVNRSQS